MHGASRSSLLAARERFDTLVESPDVDAEALSEELFGFVGLLDRELGLRRVLSDPSLDGSRKADLVASLVGGRDSAAAIDLLGGLVRSRWSRVIDLADAAEILAVSAEVVVAERSGHLDDLEDQLFRFSRIVEGQPALRAALADPALPLARKHDLVVALLEGKATPSAIRLLSRVVTDPRGRHVEAGFELYGQIASERRQRLVALVRAATPLTDEQRTRLAAALARTYGGNVHLNVELDPTVIGGLSINVGDEVIDGTIAARLSDARRRLAG